MKELKLKVLVYLFIIIIEKLSNQSGSKSKTGLKKMIYNKETENENEGISEEFSGNEGRTVFSKVSYQILELYSNGASSRFNTFNRDVAYSMMVNDHYLSRVSEKTVLYTKLIIIYIKNIQDSELLKVKINDFLTRNQELEEKRHFKLRLKKDEVIKEKDKLCYQVPNNKVVEKIRNPKDYYKDQLKFNENRRLKIEELRKRNIAEELSENRPPEINKVISLITIQNSDKMVKHRTGGKKKMFGGKLYKDQFHLESKSFINKEIDYSKKVIDPVTKKNIILGKAPEKDKTKLVINIYI